MGCNCLNCQTEGYFEFVNGFIPKDCTAHVPRPTAMEEEITCALAKDGE